MYKLFKRIIIGIGLTVMLFSLSNVEAKIHEEEVLVNITASLGNDNKNVELISDNRDYGSTFNVSFDDIDQDYNFLYWIIDGVIDFDKTESNLEFTLEDGIDELSFEYRKAYTGGTPRQLEVTFSVDGEEDIVINTDVFGEGSGEQDDIYEFIAKNLSIDKKVTIKIKNVGSTTGNRQTVIDNIIIK